MSRISVTGPKKHLEDLIEELHDLQLLDIEQYEGELETGNPGTEAEELSGLLVDIRSLLSKLPQVESENEQTSIDKVEREISELTENLEKIEGRDEELKRKKENLNEERKFFKRLVGAGIRFRDLQESERLGVWVGKIEEDVFTSEIDNDRYGIFEGRSASAVIYSKNYSEEIEKALQRTSG
ncbi:MAG: hypothetical protein V5A72_02080, partial [Candidatus Nanohaloarchaea archaeon]